MKDQMKTNLTAVLKLILIIAVFVLSRLIPHPANFTAIGALTLLSGTLFSDKKWSLVLPLVVLFIGDLILGFHAYMFWTYSAVLFFSLSAPYLMKKMTHRFKYFIGTMGWSLFFFFWSNLGVFLEDRFYPMTINGFLTCYAKAIPFLGYEWLSTLAYSALVLTTFAVVDQTKQLA